MNVVSLFDGMSCGQIALNRAGFKVNNYYAAEIDKHAIKVTQANHPNTQQMGDVTKWREWDINWESIDLVTGGFPCQAWSMAGKQLGDKDERGMLFWTMLDIMKHVLDSNPKAKFIIENVKMKQEFESYITYHTEQALGYVNKTLINSALVSAQNRKRFYWTNFFVEQPQDKEIMLADILESDGTGWVKNHGQWSERKNKTQCIDANYYKGIDNHGARTAIKCASIIGRKINPETGKRDDDNENLKTEQRIEIRNDEKTNCLTTVQKDNVVVSDCHYRKLTPVECERLQTMPDNYTAHVSNTQRYKMIGNSWTVDVIVHILNEMLTGQTTYQEKLF